MIFKKKPLSILLMCGVSLTACETPPAPPPLNVQVPFSSLKAQREVSPAILYAFQLLKEAKYSEASQFINITLQSQPKSALLHILNALAYEKLAERGDATGLELAAVGYQNAINLEPSNLFAITQLAKLKVQEKQFGEAQELFANALLITPNDPNLLHELAAASYYAYDIQNAISAIRKAEKLAPTDPLIHRSAAMIYAAVGEFTTAKTHLDIFQAKAGKDPGVAQTINRFNDWSSLYKNGRIQLASAGSGEKASFRSPPDISSKTEEQALNSMEAAEQQVNQGPQIIVDCYMLRLQEEATTSKGNNILKNLAVTLSPGGFTGFSGRLGGSSLSGNNSQSGDFNQNNVTQQSAVGFKANQAVGQGMAPAVFTPSATTVNLFNQGSLSGNVFTSGITWAGLTYSLNIANAIDNRTEVVSRPSLMTFLNKQSIFFSGDELVTGLSGQFGGGSLTRYPVGVTLIITPESLEGDMLTLFITIEGSVLTAPNPNLQQTVDVAKTRVDTYAKVRLGETLMLGGLYERQELYAKDGFPGLRDIPIAQYFFSNESTSSMRRSIMFMLTPRSPDLVKSAVNRALARRNQQPSLTELPNRDPDWFASSPNLVAVFKYLSRDPVIYYEFRSGDVLPPSWGWEPSLEDKLTQLTSFLYY